MSHREAQTAVYSGLNKQECVPSRTGKVAPAITSDRLTMMQLQPLDACLLQQPRMLT